MVRERGSLSGLPHQGSMAVGFPVPSLLSATAAMDYCPKVSALQELRE